MNKIIVALAVVGLVVSGWSIDIPSPDADGKVVFDVANGQYVATDSVTCTQVVFGANNVSVDLSASGGKTIAIPSTVAADAVFFAADDLSAAVYGGTWDLGGSAKINVGIAPGGYRGGRLEFNDTTVDNVGDIVIGNGKRDCSLLLTNNATLNAKSLRISSSSGHHCSFEILNGSTATFSGNFVPEEGQIGAQGGNLLWIDGLGSSVSVPNKSVLLGRGRSNDRMLVSNKGAFSAVSLSVGGTFTKSAQTDYATDTVLTVDDATLTTTTGGLTIGSGTGGSTGLVNRATLTVGTDMKVGDAGTTPSFDNLLSVSGSVVTVGGALCVGYEGGVGNRAEFRDTALSANSMRVGVGANSTNNTLVLAGDVIWTQTKAGTDSKHPFFFGDGGGNVVILEDGFQFTPGDEYVMAASGNNLIRIRTGAKATKGSGTWRIGTVDNLSHDNTFSVEEGGTAVVYRAYLGGSRNRIVVSNGVFQVMRKDVTSIGAMYIGYDGDDPVANPAVGCELVLRGTRPEYTSVGETEVCGNGKGILRFELPAAALETVPMSCGIITVKEGSAIHVACEDYLSYLGDERGNVVLARASTATRLVIPQSVLDATNAELSERCRVVVDGTDLVLKIRGNKGLMLIFR